MKIFILANASGYGGAERSLEQLVSEWKKNNIITVFVENDLHAENLKEILNGNGYIIPLKRGNAITIHLYNMYVVYKNIIRSKPSYIITNTNKAALYLSLIAYLCKFPKKRIMIFVRDFQWKYANFIMTLMRHAVVAIPNKATLEYGVNKKIQLGKYNKIFITGNPVMIPQLSQGYIVENYILLLANICMWKGIIYAIKAYKRSGLYKRGVKLYIYGKIVDNNYYNECELYINKYGLKDMVRIDSFCKNNGEVYSKCLMVLNTSISKHGGPETFGRTIIEAWSYKKPVIVFATGALKYIVEDGVDGFCVPEENVDLLSERMKLLVDDDKLANTMGESGYKKVIMNYEVRKVSSKIMNYIKSIV